MFGLQLFSIGWKLWNQLKSHILKATREERGIIIITIILLWWYTDIGYTYLWILIGNKHRMNCHAKPSLEDSYQIAFWYYTNRLGNNSYKWTVYLNQLVRNTLLVKIVPGWFLGGNSMIISCNRMIKILYRNMTRSNSLIVAESQKQPETNFIIYKNIAMLVR